MTSGTSSSASQVGGNLICVIIDEMAAMSSADGEDGTDSDLYSTLKPSTATFGSDGKVICALGDTVGMVAGAMVKKFRADFDKRLKRG